MKDVIQKRLERCACQTAHEEENALSEITQEVILYALSISGFFQHASFQGGTCLRIVHGLDRFSEDLDFCLKRPKRTFDLDPFLVRTRKVAATYGYSLDISGKDLADLNVRKRFLKDDSLKKLLVFRHLGDLRKKIRVKVEVDVNPPAGALTEQEFLDFPIDFSLLAHDKSTLFAGKCHALLCREYTKGRDWYDFIWFVAESISPNYNFLASALGQTGPWRGKGIRPDAKWLREALLQRIDKIKWKDASEEVSRFLKPERKKTLSLWSKIFFTKKVEKMMASSE